MNKVSVKIKSVANVKNGSTPSTAHPDFYGGDIIWITPKDLSDQNKKYIVKGHRTVTKKGLDSCSSVLVPKGTVLLSSRAPIGLLSIAGTELCTNQGFKNIIPNKDKLDSDFLFYYLKVRIKEVENLGSGTTFKEVSKSSIENYEISIPEKIQDQQKIASVLSSLDSKIELNNRINTELEQMAKTLYDYWFVQFDFPDQNNKPYKTSGGKMVWNEELKRDIPEGWGVDVLENNLTIERGISYQGTDIQDKGIPMVNLNSFYLDGRYKDEGIKYFAGSINDNKVIHEGDLMIATTDVTRNAYIIGKSFILPDLYDGRVIASCDIAKVKVGDKLDKYFLDMLFNSDNYHRYIKGFASGTLVLHLDTKGIDWYKCLIPPKYLLNKYASFKKNIDRKKTLTLKENKKLSELRDWLLPMLMNGQVTVK